MAMKNFSIFRNQLNENAENHYTSTLKNGQIQRSDNTKCQQGFMVQTWTYLARLCVWMPNDPVLLFFRYTCLYQLQVMLCSDKKYFQNLCNLNQYRFILPLHDHYGCCGEFFKYCTHIWAHREIPAAILLVNMVDCFWMWSYMKNSMIGSELIDVSSVTSSHTFI